MLLAKPGPAPLLKQWLIQHEPHHPDMLRAAMRLTKTGNSISWPLDITACQNDKLIYIAPPRARRHRRPAQRWRAHQPDQVRKHERLTLPSDIHSDGQEPRPDRQAHQRAARSGRHEQAQVHLQGPRLDRDPGPSPTAASITEIKIERGFVYFNLNGGDSWAYYHPENNPDFIYNFKGEPAYLTKELLPDYWEQLTQQSTKTNSARASRS
jgi:hypothetical protein